MWESMSCKQISQTIVALDNFLNIFLAAPQSTLGHYRGGSLNNPMLINVFL